MVRSQVTVYKAHPRHIAGVSALDWWGIGGGFANATGTAKMRVFGDVLGQNRRLTDGRRGCP